MLWICSLVLAFQYSREIRKSKYQSSVEEYCKRDLTKNYGGAGFNDPGSLKLRNIRICEINRNAKLRKNWSVAATYLMFVYPER